MKQNKDTVSKTSILSRFFLASVKKLFIEILFQIFFSCKNKFEIPELVKIQIESINNIEIETQTINSIRVIAFLFFIFC